ncbi:MAG TPA: class I SAM-dependent methyltransferase [Gemmataceae bacterium]|nr:class I SAM-dependent methyltransferase [Gemmataceae bacterium]
MTASLKEQERFYDRYWAERPTALNPAEVERLGEIYAAVALALRHSGRKSFSICDFGCGTGWLSAELSKFGRVKGVELSPEGAAIARQRYPQASFEAANILTWRPAERFDLVVSSEVIEHIEDKAAFIVTVDAILKPGGYLILTTPNQRVRRWWDATNSGEQILEYWMTPSELRRLLPRGYAILHHRTFLFDYFYAGIFRVLSAPKLLGSLRAIGLLPLYDGLRDAAKLGLYQILVARKPG